MLMFSIALLTFIFFVSFQVWPQAVLVISFLTGVQITLRYLLFGVHRTVLGICWMFTGIGAISSGYSHGVMGWNPLAEGER